MHSEVPYVKACVNRSLAVALAALALAAPGLHAQPLQLRDALEQALSRNPDIAVARTGVEAARGQKQQAQGQFDWNLYANMSYQKLITPLTDSAVAANGGGIEQARVYTSGYQAGVSRQLRSGVLLDANVDTLGEQDRSAPPWLAQQNLSRLNLTLTLPLLRGRGVQAVGAAEDAARLAVEARRYALLDSAARTLYSTLVAYWEYRARIELEKVAISSEERSISLLNSIQKLVDASERPRADLVLLQADRADKAASREAAALARIEARQALGRVLGLDAAAIARLPEPADTLPEVATALPPPAHFEALGTVALERRPDVRALALQVDAARRLLAGVSDQLKPRLDVDVGLTQARASEGGGRYGMLARSGRLQSEPSVFAKLVFEFPLKNNLAKGAVREQAALAAQLEIQQRDLAIGVATGVEGAWQALSSNAAQLRTAREGLSLYEKAVSQETTKQRNGIATLIDVINTESRFVNARINYLQIQLAYASALARLRLETGTLVPTSALREDTFAIDVADLGGLGPLAAPSSSTR